MSSWAPTKYKTTNWSAYNDALKRRGSLELWFDPEMVRVPPPGGKRGRQQRFSNAAIQACLTLKVLFGMVVIGCAIGPSDNYDQVNDRLRAEPAASGRFGLGGAGLHHTMPSPEDPECQPPVSRRTRAAEPSDPLSLLQAAIAGQRTVQVSNPQVRASGTRASIPLTHASMCCRTEGGPKRRIWRKIHIGIDAETLEVRAVEVTTVMSVTRKCCPNCSTKSRPIRTSGP